MNVYLYDMLMCTEIEINFNGKTKMLRNVANDTGAAQSIFNSSSVEDIGIVPSVTDKVSKTRGSTCCY